MVRESSDAQGEVGAMKLRNKRGSRLPTYTNGVRDRLCKECGSVTKGVELCCHCFSRSPAGKAEAAYKALMKKYVVLMDGGPCQGCSHWCGRCSLGFPEGGSAYAADCPAMFTA